MKGDGNLEAFNEYELYSFNKIILPKADLKKLITLSLNGKNNMYSELYYKYEHVDEETASNLFLIHIKPIKYKHIHVVLWVMFLSLLLTIFTLFEKLFGIECNIEQSKTYLKSAFTTPFKQFELYLEVGGNTEMGQAIMKNEKIQPIIESIQLEKNKTQAEKHDEFISEINGG